MTREDWLAALQEAEAAARPVNDPDVITLREFAELLQVSPEHAGRRMRQLVAAGLAESARKQIVRLNGAYYTVNAYRLKQKQTKEVARAKRSPRH